MLELVYKRHLKCLEQNAHVGSNPTGGTIAAFEGCRKA